MAIQVAGEGWIDDLYDWFGAPQWVQVYDRRSTPQIPVGLPPGGGTQPLLPNGPPAQLPAVVPRYQPTFNIPVLPPAILNGVPDVPSGSVGGEDSNEEETVALADWIQGGIDIANTWGGYTSAQAVQAASSYGSTMPPPVTLPSGQILNGPMSYAGGACKRRKRQRNILTQANIGIMWQISSLPNNANVRIALARAIR